MTTLVAYREPAVGPRPAPARAPRRGRLRWLVLALLILVGVVVLVPFALVVMNAFKSAEDYASNGALSFPRRLDFDSVVEFWRRVDFSRKLLNSVLISGSVAIGGSVLSLLNAFALGIGRVKGRYVFLVVFLTANLLPQESLVYPLYYLAKEVGLYDTRLSVIIIFIVIQSAFGTYLLTSVLAAFPRQIIEAATIDGATKWQVLCRVVFPLSRPTLAVLFTFFFIWTWNEFFLPLIFLVSNDNQTVPVAVGVLQGQRMMDATAQSASALLGILPAIVFFLIFQRTLTRGVTAGALK